MQGEDPGAVTQLSSEASRPGTLEEELKVPDSDQMRMVRTVMEELTCAASRGAVSHALLYGGQLRRQAYI